MADHRTMTADAFFACEERSGLSTKLAVLNGRTFIEIRTVSGRSVLIPIADAADLAAAIDRLVATFVARECAKPKVSP